MSDIPHCTGCGEYPGDFVADRIEELEADLRKMALDYLAAEGQAAEAYQAQLAAEAKLKKAVEAIEKMRHASDAMMLYIARTTLAELKGEDRG
jgi:hypothetical protein